MNDDTFQAGTIQRSAAGFTGQLRRSFAHPAARVWQMLTAPAEMAKWLAPGTIEPKLGGAVRINFADSGILIESSVSAFEDQRLLEYSWSSGDEPERPLRWQLSAQGDSTELTLNVSVPASEDISKACAGFDGHLEMLAAALEDVPVKFPFELYMQARKAYQEALAAL